MTEQSKAVSVPGPLKAWEALFLASGIFTNAKEEVSNWVAFFLFFAGMWCAAIEVDPKIRTTS